MAVGSLAMSAYNAYQNGKERKKEERHREETEKYNKELNAAKVAQQQALNNPKLQVGKLKEAGLNPNAYTSGQLPNQESAPTQPLAQQEVKNSEEQKTIEIVGQVINALIQSGQLDVSQQNADTARSAMEESVRHDQVEEALTSAQQDINRTQVGINDSRANFEAKDIESKIRQRAVQVEAQKIDNEFRKKYNPQELEKQREEVQLLASQDKETRARTAHTWSQKQNVDLLNKNEAFQQECQRWSGMRADEMPLNVKTEIVQKMARHDWDGLLKLQCIQDPANKDNYIQQMAELKLRAEQAETGLKEHQNDNAYWENDVMPVIGDVIKAVGLAVGLKKGLTKPNPVGFR